MFYANSDSIQFLLHGNIDEQQHTRIWSLTMEGKKIKMMQGMKNKFEIFNNENETMDIKKFDTFQLNWNLEIALMRRQKIVGSSNSVWCRKFKVNLVQVSQPKSI